MTKQVVSRLALVMAACGCAGGTTMKKSDARSDDAAGAGEASAAGVSMAAAGGTVGVAMPASGQRVGSGEGGSGVKPPDMALAAGEPDAALADATGAATDRASPAAGAGKVLYIAGDKPMVGTDLQIHQALKARNLEVEDLRETATPAQTAGKRLIIMSYSMLSTDFKAEAFADVPVAIIVMEHFLLPRLGMTTAGGHGYQFGATLTIASNDADLTGGLKMGDVSPYTAQGKEMFWGVPGPGGLKIAAMKGSPDHWVMFAYPAGAMMAGKPAPGKRLQFFAASHAPPAVPDQLLNADGLKLLGAAIDWSIK